MLGNTLNKLISVTLPCLLCVQLMSGQTATPSVVGDYGATLWGTHIVLHLQRDQAGSLIGTLDIVDQGEIGIPCAQIMLSGKQISFTVPKFETAYKGELAEDGTNITGTMDQDTPLVFTRKVLATAASLSKRLAELDSTATADFAKHSIGSMTIAVVSGDQLIWTKSYGNADVEKHHPATKDTVYRIGSITKMFTALMLEQLVDSGKVHLSDPVEKYFPEVATIQGRFPGAPPITLVQLATHTSGLGREPDDTETYVHGAVSDWEKTLITALPHVHYIFEPGTRYSYSNIGYAVLGAALARAAGQPYVDYIPHHIFEPLGMTHSALELNPQILPQLAKGYQANPKGVDADAPQREQAGRGYKVPNGAIYTTVGDLARFCSFLMGHGPSSVLKTDSLERYQYQLAVPANSLLTSGYGLGFTVTRQDNYIAFGHDGAVTGYQAGLEINRDAEIGVLVLANAIGPGTVNVGDLTLSSLDRLSK
jgi:CubicO group peptidase (beta-lactamase class C family)